MLSNEQIQNKLPKNINETSGILKLKLNTTNKFASGEFKTNHDPSPKGKDITQGRSNSSANTTSHSALSSSVAMSRDTMKL